MIPVFRPTIKRKEMDSVLTTLVSDVIGPGPVGEELVKVFADKLSAGGGFAFATYPDAIGLALSSLDLESGSSVVISALSPAFYLDELARFGLEASIIDVSEENGSLFIPDALRAIEEGAKAVLLHYPLGFIPETEPLVEAGVPLIEDVTSAFGGHDGSRLCGTAGDYAVIGLEPNHLITAGEGALVIARGRKQLSRLKQSVEGSLCARLMPDFCAALALVQLKESEGYFERRKELAALFSKAVMKGRHNMLVQPGEGENVHYSFPIMIESSVKDVGSYARKKGVETCLAFADSVMESMDDGFPKARQFMLRCLLFPLYPMLGKSQAEQISKVLSTLP
ncbi:DegT/DnrJ/EryC1/StrS family aminotransferase [Sediminispirochaeta smaragdinae]|uniref:DegT/DnrJ/EryC1/StrS aminotransferase n=1 Tax=Sediminispirochaeta smaragdinae (strain DSM 11293 / JCM 15392 / SEBR 4228) TaxID=573413 RepID=E1R5P5_SEDSS|nr:DegT/DnrJ/EryC1/StrS family aminotransferase [Sediminispirochaeta smaragdinae]ADK80660.1 DegT/DnrJ/EryC1/StrS aminotransferase [Sediminispirochaeta smaragdinae DSM 11293]